MARVPKKARGPLLPFDRRHRNLAETTAITLDLLGRHHLPSHRAGLRVPKLPVAKGSE